MYRKIKQILILFCIIMLLILPYFVFAQGNLQDAFGNTTLDPTAAVAGYQSVDNSSVARIAGTVIKAFLSLLGIIFIILIIYGGYLWMTARGNEQQVEKAKDVLQKSIIGLIIIVSSYAIWTFIYEAILS